MVFFLITVVGHTDINWYTLYLYAFTYVLVLYWLKGMRCVRDIFSSTLITSKPHHEPNIWNHACPLYIFVSHIYRSQNITFIWWIAKSHISFFLQFLWSSFLQFTQRWALYLELHLPCRLPLWNKELALGRWGRV